MRSTPDLSRGIGVHRRDAESNDQIGPSGERVGGHKSRHDDGDVCHGIILSRKEGGPRQAAAMGPETHQQERACQIDSQRARTGTVGAMPMPKNNALANLLANTLLSPSASPAVPKP